MVYGTVGIDLYLLRAGLSCAALARLSVIEHVPFIPDIDDISVVIANECARILRKSNISITDYYSTVFKVAVGIVGYRIAQIVQTV